MNAAIEAIRNKEMGSSKASSVFNLPQKTQQSYVKDWQESSSNKTKLGRKQDFPCEGERYPAEHCLERKESLGA